MDSGKVLEVGISVSWYWLFVMLESMPRVSSLAVHTISASHAEILHAQSPIVRASSLK